MGWLTQLSMRNKSLVTDRSVYHYHHSVKLRRDVLIDVFLAVLFDVSEDYYRAARRSIIVLPYNDG